MSYTSFAAYYDRLMSDCDYAERADYLLGLFEQMGHIPQCLLDLCCGTGSLMLEFARRGIDVIGVDVSADMLAVARDKADAEGLQPLLLCQNATELDLYGTVDGAVCTLDSLNHLTDYNDFSAALSNVALFLEPGGYFIFDVNTLYKHREVLGDNTFVIDEDDLYCVWQNHCDGEYVDVELDFFADDGSGRYLRSGESFSERAYSDDEIYTALETAGLTVVDVLDDMSLLPPHERSERKIFIARK